MTDKRDDKAGLVEKIVRKVLGISQEPPVRIKVCPGCNNTNWGYSTICPLCGYKYT